MHRVYLDAVKPRLFRNRRTFDEALDQSLNFLFGHCTVLFAGIKPVLIVRRGNGLFDQARYGRAP